jgi:hypothetical protein
MALDHAALLEVLDTLKAGDAGERIRVAAGTMYQALIETELTATIGAQPLLVVHGACPPGADAHASAWVRARRGEGQQAAEEPHPADWRGGRGTGCQRRV